MIIVSSEFKLIAYVSMIVVSLFTVAILVVNFVVAFAPSDGIKMFFMVLPFSAIMCYILLMPKKIDIYDNEVRYESAILPFKEGRIAFEDADYYVTQKNDEDYDLGMKVMIIKDSKIVFSFPSTLYSNIDEIISALPWEYRGEYHPDFFDQFKWSSINESRIDKIDEKTT